MCNMPILSSTRPMPLGHEIYNFVRPFLDHHYYIFSLPDLCPGDDVQRNYTFSKHDLPGILSCPSTRSAGT